MNEITLVNPAKRVDEEDKIDGVAICDPICRTKTAGKQSHYSQKRR